MSESIDYSKLGQYMLLVGITNTGKMDEYFASGMVDIAYIDEITDDTLKVITDVGIDLRNEQDRTWIIDLLAYALAECGETQAQVEVHAQN